MFGNSSTPETPIDPRTNLNCMLKRFFRCKGWLSEADIEKGSIWFDELTKQLSDTGVGILSVTRNNQNGEIMLTRLMPLETG